MVSVPDAASIAAMRWTSRITGRLVGGSTGTAMWGALRLIASMHADRTDPAASSRCCATAASATPRRTTTTTGSPKQGIDIAPYVVTLEKFYDTGTWTEVSDG